MKAVCSRTVRHIVVNAGRLPARYLVCKTIDEIDQIIAKILEEALTTLLQEGIIQAGAVAAWEVLYVPAGAFVFEAVVSGSLIFGVRRAILVKSRGATQSYK